jgi:[acyl-carrier-protein] S-malonyltransferase
VTSTSVAAPAGRDGTALLFPGQGSQRVGMGRELAAEHALARQTMDEADDALGFALSRVCFEGPEAELTRTEHCQPAILAVSVALWRALGAAADLTPQWLAGHSLGEYTALVVGGALGFADALRLVRLRGRLMQAAVPEGVGAMAAIVGADDARVAEVCVAAAENEVVAPANYNGAGQVVIAGHRAAVARAAEALREAGARVIPLNVSAPFHCRLMAPVAAELATALAGVEIAPLAVPIITNVEAAMNADAGRVRELLIEQVTAPVRWSQSMETLHRLGCRRAVEVGPGRVLTNILQRMRLGIAADTLATLGPRRSAEASA